MTFSRQTKRFIPPSMTNQPFLAVLYSRQGMNAFSYFMRLPLYTYRKAPLHSVWTTPSRSHQHATRQSPAHSQAISRCTQQQLCTGRNTKGGQSSSLASARGSQRKKVGQSPPNHKAHADGDASHRTLLAGSSGPLSPVLSLLLAPVPPLAPPTECLS